MGSTQHLAPQHAAVCSVQWSLVTAGQRAPVYVVLCQLSISQWLSGTQWPCLVSVVWWFLFPVDILAVDCGLAAGLWWAAPKPLANSFPRVKVWSVHSVQGLSAITLSRPRLRTTTLIHRYTLSFAAFWPHFWHNWRRQDKSHYLDILRLCGWPGRIWRRRAAGSAPRCWRRASPCPWCSPPARPPPPAARAATQQL